MRIRSFSPYQKLFLSKKNRGNRHQYTLKEFYQEIMNLPGFEKEKSETLYWLALILLSICLI